MGQLDSYHADAAIGQHRVVARGAVVNLRYHCGEGATLRRAFTDDVKTRHERRHMSVVIVVFMSSTGCYSCCW
jgi:hypothetical protein